MERKHIWTAAEVKCAKLNFLSWKFSVEEQNRKMKTCHQGRFGSASYSWMSELTGRSFWKKTKTACQVQLLGLGDCPYFSHVTWLYFPNCFSVVLWLAATINYKSVFWGTIAKLKNYMDLYSSFTIMLSRLRQYL